MSCIFCENAFADPVLPQNRQKICVLFDVSFSGKKLLHDGKICTKCHVQVDLIDNAMKLKTEMSQCLQDKLSGEERLTNSANHSSLPMNVSPPPLAVPPKIEKTSVPNLMKSGFYPPMSSSGPPLLTSPPLPPGSAAEMMAMASLQSSLVALASTPMMAMPPMQSMPPIPSMPLMSAMPQPQALTPADSPAASLTSMENKGGAYMCMYCGIAFKEPQELATHDSICSLNNRGNGSEMSPTACDRCGQSLKYQSPEERIKHIIQCKGQGMRRGRPSTGIINCPKCGLKLKNRMNQDRINHVERCNGSGLKRGRPSLKSVDKFQCEKCGRNLWSREQLELHASKCDGNHVERRGRKPGDNICMVCGENLIYRHILKKHLRQAHGINPQNLDDSVIAAVKNEHSVEDLSTPYKKILLNQIQQHLPTTMPINPGSPQAQLSEEPNQDDNRLSQSFDSTLGHRKKGIPCKYVGSEGDSVSCDRCEKVFENREMFEGHICFLTSAEGEPAEMESIETLSNEEPFSCDRCEKYFESQQHFDQHQCSERSANRQFADRQTSGEETTQAMEDEQMSQTENVDVTNSEPESVDDVISAISERAEAVGSSSSIKGSAIAQVISGLLGANKQLPNGNGGTSTLPVHRQSIST